jgi:hypothetical protein
MRLILCGVAALALAACGVETKPADPAKPADSMAATGGHDMAAMSGDMKSMDSADDTNTAETPANYTFHTFPEKIESVHLPTEPGATWAATASDTTLVEVGEAKDETMPDGKLHHVVKVTPKKAGNATVKFEHRAGADMAGPITETRTINFMVH